MQLLIPLKKSKDLAIMYLNASFIGFSQYNKSS